MALQELQLIDEQIGRLDQEWPVCSAHTGRRSATGRGTWSGSRLSTADHCRSRPHRGNIPSEKCLSSWGGACPGDDETAGVNHSTLSKGHVRCDASSTKLRMLRQDQKEASSKSCIAAPSRAWTQSSHRSHCPSTVSLIGLILHQGVRYEERGQRSPNDRSNYALGE